MMKIFEKKYKPITGFTLIELLIVVAVIAILAAFTFVALNPLARFQDSRNARRWSDVNAILAAIKLNQVDNNGEYLASIEELATSTYYQIGTGDMCQRICSYPTVTITDACVNLTGLVSAGYLPDIPYNPNDTSSDEEYTGYYLMKGDNGMITVGSCDEEKGTNTSVPEIFVSR